jgi:cbb3-type cytochrome oxidase maturation protein
MESIYLLIPIALVIFALIIALLFWAVRSGQFDDIEREGGRILFDDDLEDTKRDD